MIDVPSCLIETEHEGEWCPRLSCREKVADYYALEKRIPAPGTCFCCKTYSYFIFLSKGTGMLFVVLFTVLLDRNPIWLVWYLNVMHAELCLYLGK